MLIPVSIELTPSDYLKYREHKEIIENLGFKVEEFGINTILIKSHPTWLLEGYHEVDIKALIEEIISYPEEFSEIRFRDRFAATVACKMSVKGNENITLEQADNILKKLVKCDNPYNCPHGRPTIIKFTIYDLERMFKRVMN
jgi:DNA mismatch repair protein MutL